MATPFHVRLLTPERMLFDGDAEEVSMRTDGGEIAFLAHHEDFIGALDITIVRIAQGVGASLSEEAQGAFRAAVHGGFVHVDDDGVTILAGVAELEGEVDVERARAALRDAESQSAEAPPTEEEGDHIARSPAMIALLSPDSADARARRARTRLELAGASVSA